MRDSHNSEYVWRYTYIVRSSLIPSAEHSRAMCSLVYVLHQCSNLRMESDHAIDEAARDTQTCAQDASSLQDAFPRDARCVEDAMTADALMHKKRRRRS